MLGAVGAVAGCASPSGARVAGYTVTAESSAVDTLRVRMVQRTPAVHRSQLIIGAVVSGYLSSRGLPPVKGRFTITDSGLVFRASDGATARFPLVGPARSASGKQRRAANVSLAYIDEVNARPAYVFRVDAGVFETDLPGQLLELASNPLWLDSLAPAEGGVDRTPVKAADTTALWTTARHMMMSRYADTLYSLFGMPRAPVGLIGARGRAAGRLGEYVGSRDSLALDPARMTGSSQLRHTVAHELGHRWQARAPGQVATLWSGIAPIRDPKRYGYGNRTEHQAEAIAFAISFLQATAKGGQSAATSLALLDHYELLVPGTRTMVRYLALQPIFRRHPLARLLTGTQAIGERSND